ncbi:MAG: proline racemase family protein [Candidatus Eisenbacteria bacterium]|nr:proline racemase family protein [Candidatus Eisenbacteria bacterium]
MSEPRHEIEVIDSHTEGEPTRVVLRGGPELTATTMTERREQLRTRHDAFRTSVVLEPRGHEAMVGALLTPPVEPGSIAGVIFFNNVGYLGMCGHGLIGVVRTLEHLGRIAPGVVRIDTPVGTVGARLHDDASVTLTNVPARVAALDVPVEVAGVGTVTGDIAWGGNWFFLSHHDAIEVRPSRLGELMAATLAIKMSLLDRSITGDDGGEIDHIELFGPPVDAANHSRNFVLCPGAQYDRSPCGTGTSAKLAVLHARGDLALGEEWRQESIVGGLFIGRLERMGDELVPLIRGRAFISARATLLYDPRDPFRTGLR